jgi:short-subunit dehydrogenase
LNISSGSAYPNTPTPFISVYAASKAFNYKFSTSVQQELPPNSGVEVLAVTPFFVVISNSIERKVSNMSKLKNSSLWVPNGSQLASSALNKTGLGLQVINSWIPHYFQQ